MSFERLADIYRTPSELLDYVEWLKLQRRPSTGRDYLFSEERPRFEPRRDDVLVAMPGLHVAEKGRSLRLQCAEPRVDLDLSGIARRDVDRILASIDGNRCLAEVLWDSGVDQDKLARFLRAAFGLVLFAPATILKLEQALPSTQIVRFPCVPYAVERAYWHNMCDARAHIVDRLDALADGPAFVELLRQAHVLSLMGSTLDSYYQPASPSADQRVAPGNFFQAEPRVLRRAGCNVFVDGPRVNVSLAGAQGYHRALLGDLGDEPAGDDERDHVVDGVSWGSVLVARAEKDDRARSWFCPPRPIRAEHLETLRCHAQQASLRQSHAQVIESCALFHQAFVRLHPFHCANQSLAMNWVNALLSRSLGAGIPHLTLDLLALRLEPHAYARLFQRAVASWIVHEPDPVWRFAVLRERKNRSQSLIARVSACTSDPERDTLIGSDPEAARWALLRG